jgi:hypothetical protein
MSPRKVGVHSVEGEVPKLDLTQVRKWGDVAPEIQRLRSQGKDIPAIAEELQVSYVLVNQCIIQSYKMVIDSVYVFERQEKKRLGIEE